MMQAQPVLFSELCGFWGKQWQATEAADTHRFTLFGGSRGPGKSYWLRWYGLRRLLMWAARGHRQVDVVLACEDYPALKNRQITKIAREFPAELGVLKDTKERGLGFHLRDAYGGGSLLLRNLDDPAKYQSMEFAGLLIDELTRNSFRTFSVLRGSLRWPGIDDTFFAGASNPAPGWVRDLWITGDFDHADYRDLRLIADQFVFVPALPEDNPALSEDYWQMLRTLPTHLRQAWLEGDWFVAVEGLVYEEFAHENLLPDDWVPDPETPVELAFDDGYIDPRAIYFIQRSASHIYIFDELYERKRLAEESVRRVVERTAHHFGWADDDQTRPNNLPELAVGSHEAKELHRHFRRADIPARSLNHKVVEGIKVVRRLIRDGNGHRALQVHPRCRNLIDELTSGYRYPDGERRRADEKPADGHDHGCDAIRYWCYVRAR